MWQHAYSLPNKLRYNGQNLPTVGYPDKKNGTLVILRNIHKQEQNEDYIFI